jgi:dTDP-4-amino-4,6-dideoxygalactose transaminase
MSSHSQSKQPTTISVPLLDIVQGNQPDRDEIIEALARVVDSGRFLFGPDVTALEAEIARRCQVPHGIGCASGSDALLLALLALDIGPGDEVLVPSFTFFATASCVWRLGATPVFVDIDRQTFNIDVGAAEAAVTTSTRAIIPVHLFGQCAEMDRIGQLAERHGLHVIEDAAQAIGAAFDGRPAGGWGDVGCFSFYPTKNLGGMGDGGMLTARTDALAERLRLFAAHGMQPRYYHQVVGINSRLDTFQAAALNVKIKHLDQWTRQRQENAARYASLFEEARLDSAVQLPTTDARCHHVWNQYTIRVPEGRRDAIREHLGQCGVGSEIYYPIPLHRQQCFTALGYSDGSLPETERAAREVLSLPISPELTESQQAHVVGSIKAFYSKKAAA